MAANATEAMGALCVITAADIEFNTVAKLLSAHAVTIEDGLQVLRGGHNGRAITLLKTEIGAVGFAEKLRVHLAHDQYAALVVIGLAGALDPALRTGAVVVYDGCLDGLGAETFCDQELARQLFEAFNRQGLSCQRGTGLSVARVVIEARQKLTLHQQTKAGVVDMETSLVLTTVADLRLPCAAVRVVMDEAANDLPDFNAGLDATGRVQLWPTLRALAARPRATLAFLLTLRPALRRLDQVARAILTGLDSR